MKKIEAAGYRGLEAKWPVIFAFFFTLFLLMHLASKMWVKEEFMEWIRISFGIMAALIMFFLSTYTVRRLVFTRRLGSMEGWRRSHLYLGILCVELILLHTNFKVYGQFGVIMIFLFFLVALSGILGEIMYRTVPVWLSKQGADALELDSQWKSAAYYLTFADELAGKGSVEFKTFYNSRIRRLFATETSHLSYLVMSESDLNVRRRKIFGALTMEGPVTDKLALKSLEGLYRERDILGYKFSRLQALRWWNTAHAPATAALVVAVLWHLMSIIYY